MSIPRVTVLGSCRVYEPIKLLAEQGKVALHNKGVYGYVHYSKESVQQLRVMHGQIDIPMELKPYVTHKVVPEGSGSALRTPLNDLSETDLLVVEISSLKEIEFDGFYLQINRLREQLVGDDENLKAWWAYLYDKGLDERAEHRAVRRQFLTQDQSSVTRKLVMWTNVSIQDEASLHRDMQAIRAYFSGPIIWVSHFDTLTFSNKAIPIRQTLVQYVRSGATALEQPWFNPRAAIEEFGRNDALLDMAHYTPDFELELSTHFERLITQALVPVPEGIDV